MILEICKRLSRFGRRFLRIYPMGAGVVICLHRVVRDGEESGISELRDLELTAIEFQSLLECLHAERWAFISMDEVASGPSCSRWVALTFDDGYIDNLEVVAPICEHFEVPFTVYFVTDFLSGASTPWWCDIADFINKSAEIRMPGDGGEHVCLRCDNPESKGLAFLAVKAFLESPGMGLQNSLDEFWSVNCARASMLPAERVIMNVDELLGLASLPLVTIGSHGLTHRKFSTLDEEEIELELGESKRLLEAITGSEIRHFSFPHGDTGRQPDAVFRAALACGYQSTVTTVPRNVRRRDLLEAQGLPRKSVGGNAFSLGDLMGNLCGWDEMILGLNRRWRCHF